LRGAGLSAGENRSRRSVKIDGWRNDQAERRCGGCALSRENSIMPSFDIVSRIDLQEVDNAVNITRKAILARFDFRQSKTEIALDKKEKKIRVTTEDDMKMRAVQEGLIENLVKRKVDTKCLEIKPSQMAAQGMIQREISLKEGVDSDMARNIVKMIKDKKLKVQAAIQESQVRVTGKKIDDLQEVIHMLRATDLPIPLQFVNMQR
jgi:cyclic-di-GMP-binding protein